MCSFERLMICFALPLRTKSAYLGKQPSHMVSLGRPNLYTTPGWDLDLARHCLVWP